MKNIITFVFILFPILGFSQHFNENLRTPIWTFHTNNTTICGFSLGAYSTIQSERFVKTNGIRLEIPGIGFLVPFSNGSPIYKIETLEPHNFVFSEIINGINISTGSWGNIKFNGITIGIIAQYGNVNNGLAIAGLSNSMHKSNGVQISLLYNETLESKGFQFSLSNESLKMNGVQIGVFNRSKELKGIQIGLINRSKKFKGFQLGLWNVNAKRKLPFINWNFK